MATMLRVHSQDLHEHIVQEAGECLGSGLYTDLGIRCQDGVMVQCHRLVMSAVSPYLKQVLDVTGDEEHTILDLPDSDRDVVQSLLDIIYTGSIETSLDMIRNMLTLAHSLYIAVPVSDQLMSMLGLQLPQQQSLVTSNNSPSKPPGLEFPVSGFTAMSMWQQQILGQYAMMNGLLGVGGHPPPPPPQSSSSPTGESPPKRLKSDLSCPQNRDIMNQHINQVILTAFRPENGSYVCSVCHSSYTNKGNFKQHIEKHFKNGEFPVPNNLDVGLSNGKTKSFESSSASGGNNYKCHICHSTYSHPGNFKQHLLKHEREKRGMMGNNGSHLNNVLQSAFADRVDNGDPCKTYVCHECNRTFKHPGNFKQHMASHNKHIVSAPNFPMENMMRRPMPGLVKMVNGNSSNENLVEDKDWDCPECSEKFSKGVQLQTHMKSIHNIEMVLQPEELRTSDKSNDNDRAVSPPRLDNNDGLKALAMAAGSDRSLAQFHCDVPGCYQSFTTEGWLARHKSRQHSDVLMMTEERVFPCQQCGKVFAKMSKLTQHMKTHSPEDHYKHPCDICGKKFTRPQHVIRHKLLHTGEKPHACPNCDKSFAREDKLKHHLLKGCIPTSSNGDLDQSMDSRDSEEVVKYENEAEIDDDEENK